MIISWRKHEKTKQSINHQWLWLNQQIIRSAEICIVSYVMILYIYMIIYVYVCICVYVWLCMIMYDYVTLWLCMAAKVSALRIAQPASKAPGPHRVLPRYVRYHALSNGSLLLNNPGCHRMRQRWLFANVLHTFTTFTSTQAGPANDLH